MTKRRYINNRPLKAIFEQARAGGATLGDLEIERGSTIAESYAKSRRLNRRIIRKQAGIVADNIDGLGLKGATELIAAIGVLLSQNWGKRDKESVKKLNRYIRRREGREVV
jgi:hypothetical protein